MMLPKKKKKNRLSFLTSTKIARLMGSAAFAASSSKKNGSAVDVAALGSKAQMTGSPSSSTSVPILAGFVSISPTGAPVGAFPVVTERTSTKKSNPEAPRNRSKSRHGRCQDPKIRRGSAGHGGTSRVEELSDQGVGVPSPVGISGVEESSKQGVGVTFPVGISGESSKQGVGVTFPVGISGESSKQGVGVTPSPGNSEAVIVSKEVTEPEMEEGEFRPSDGVEAVSQGGNRSAPAGSANMDPTVGIPTEELSGTEGPHAVSAKKVFKLLLQVIIYNLWRERNARIFRGSALHLSAFFRVIDRAMRDRLLSFPSKSQNKHLRNNLFSKKYDPTKIPTREINDEFQTKIWLYVANTLISE
ncbi:LOW QUALITY PROTEIN: hypothetical protein YC2023_050223 [Brassica napus]